MRRDSGSIYARSCTICTSCTKNSLRAGKAKRPYGRFVQKVQLVQHRVICHIEQWIECVFAGCTIKVLHRLSGCMIPVIMQAKCIGNSVHTT